MSKLLARAKAKKFNADNSYFFIPNDDAYIDECCFNLQQTIELCLKYIVEMSGEEYAESHDIRAQMNILKRIDQYIPCEEKLRMIASTINSWAVETKCNDNFSALIEDIADARIIASELIEYCETLVCEK